MAPPLPAIPLIDLETRGAEALIEAAPERAAALRRIGERHYSRLGLRLGDAVGRAWLRRGANPYLAEIEAVAAQLGVPGGVALNLSYEWACTGLVGPEPGGPNSPGNGARLLRVLDWKLEGLGENVVVARATGPAGPYYNVTWPGAVGVLTAMAPGRFSAAIHQAPMRRHGLGFLGDWATNRARVWRSTALPPAHLLRQVFETCPDYATARERLIRTPIALPVIFILAGAAGHDSCIIERTEDRAAVHDGPGSWANHWQAGDFGPGWTERGHDNPGRCAGLTQLARQATRGFGWLAAPVLNPDTRLAVRANAATGDLAVLGIEQQRPATQEFSLQNNELVAA